MKLRRITCLFLVLLFFAVITVPIALAITVYQLNAKIISESAILIDADTGQILFERNMHEIMRPASITKVMTALLALELGDLNDTLIVSEEALSIISSSAASISLLPEEEFTLEDALHALAVVSAADTSNAIAEYISGTVDDFILLMNERAIELGALNTNFVNTHGMPDDEHLTTAYDMALISIAAINTPGFNEIFSAHDYEMPPTNLQETPRELENRNRMITGIYIYDGLIAGKTGWTRSSQHTLFTAAERDGRTLISILMMSPMINDKYEDATLLFDYGFNDLNHIVFSVEELEGYVLLDADGIKVSAELIAHEAFTCLIPKSFTKDHINIEYIVESGDIEEELQVRVVFTLGASPLWPGYTELGEIMAVAHHVEPIDDELDPAGEFPESENPTESDGSEPVIDEQDDDGVFINDLLSRISPDWVGLLKSIGLLFILVIIVFCYFYSQKRHRKQDKMLGKKIGKSETKNQDP